MRGPSRDVRNAVLVATLGEAVSGAWVGHPSPLVKRLHDPQTLGQVAAWGCRRTPASYRSARYTVLHYRC